MRAACRDHFIILNLIVLMLFRQKCKLTKLLIQQLSAAASRFYTSDEGRGYISMQNNKIMNVCAFSLYVFQPTLY
jgi:hypothetical protein